MKTFLSNLQHLPAPITDEQDIADLRAEYDREDATGFIVIQEDGEVLEVMATADAQPFALSATYETVYQTYYHITYDVTVGNWTFPKTCGFFSPTTPKHGEILLGKVVRDMFGPDVEFTSKFVRGS